MARLPNPGGDNGAWGTILNDFLAVSHATDGTLRANSVKTASLDDNSVTVDKIATINNPTVNQSLAFNGTAMQWANMQPFIAQGLSSEYLRGDKTWQALTKAAVSLGNVDNTADIDKPISMATQTALNAKVSGTVSVTVGVSPPTSPTIGDIWINTA